MDPNRIIQALKGTIDPKLRIAAENELNQVRRGEQRAAPAGSRRPPALPRPRPAAPHLPPAAARHGGTRPRWQGRERGSEPGGSPPPPR